MSFLSRIAQWPGVRSYSWRIGRALYLAGRGEGNNALGANSEGALVEMFARATADADRVTLLDIGGNLGEWTAMALAAFEGRRSGLRIEVFEPAPKSYEALEARFGDDDRVHLNPLALSNEDGSAQFHITSPTGGRNSLVAVGNATMDVINVAVRKGAAYLGEREIERVDLAKIDAEGHDMAVIEGLEPLIAGRRIDCIQFEYSSNWLASGRSMRDICALAERSGYRLANLIDGRLELIPGWNPELDRFFEWNYILVSPDALPKLPHRELRWTESNTLEPA